MVNIKKLKEKVKKEKQINEVFDDYLETDFDINKKLNQLYEFDDELIIDKIKNYDLLSLPNRAFSRITYLFDKIDNKNLKSFQEYINNNYQIQNTEDVEEPEMNTLNPTKEERKAYQQRKKDYDNKIIEIKNNNSRINQLHEILNDLIEYEEEDIDTKQYYAVYFLFVGLGEETLKTFIKNIKKEGFSIKKSYIEDVDGDTKNVYFYLPDENEINELMESNKIYSIYERYFYRSEKMFNNNVFDYNIVSKASPDDNSDKEYHDWELEEE